MLHEARSLALLSILALFAAATPVQAQLISITEHQEVDPQGISAGARFGREMAMSGDTLIVGAPLHSEVGPQDGAVHVYVLESGGWTLQQALHPPLTNPGSRFGSSVAIDGDRALVGATFDAERAPGAGAAYLFERTGASWTLVTKLFDAAPGANFNFGWKVGLEGDHALIAGRDYAATGIPNVVHAFSLTSGNWQFDHSFKYAPSSSLPSPTGFEPFGSVISMSGARAVIGSSLQQSQTYTRTGTVWTLEQTLDPILFPSVDLALDGDLMVGAVSDGAVVLRLSPMGWAEEQILIPSDASSFTQYGFSVALENGVVAVGSRGQAFVPVTGAVALFKYEQGVWEETLIARDAAGEENIFFGRSLAISNGQLAVGAFGASSHKGSIYRFDLSERPQSFCDGDGGDGMGCGACPCGNDAPSGTRGGCLNAAGSSASLSVSGTPSMTGDSVRFELQGANPQTFAILASAAATAPNNPMNPCFGTGSGLTFSALSGLRCIVQDVRRAGTRATDAQGAVGETNPGWGGDDGPAEGLLAQAGLVAGQTRHYQAFYRETPTAGCMRDQNTSQGISIVCRP